MMPGSAAGRITLGIVSERVAPSPKDASRSVRGTALQRVVGERRDERDDHDAHHRAGRERALGGDIEPDASAEIAHERRDRQRREEAVDHGRNAGEDLQDRLGAARSAGGAYSDR